MGLLVGIVSFLLFVVACELHLAPKSLYFDSVLKNIMFCKVYSTIGANA